MAKQTNSKKTQPTLIANDGHGDFEVPADLPQETYDRMMARGIVFLVVMVRG